MGFGRTVAMALLSSTVGLSACSSTSTVISGPLAWVRQSPATSPQARTSVSMEYVPDIGKIVMFGGRGKSIYEGQAIPYSSHASLFGDTWTYDGATWAKQSPATSPPARCYATMAYDPPIKRLVLFGGMGTNAASGYDSSNAERWLYDTWTYDGATWADAHPAMSPSQQGQLVYDPALGKLFLFGGGVEVATGQPVERATWTYDGTTWTKGPQAATPPASGSITYDAALRKIVLLESRIASEVGSSTATWTYDGTTWTLQSPLASPPARYGAPMVYASTIRQTVLFGGSFSQYRTNYDLNDTWTYTGRTWTQVSTIAPPARSDASMVYDPRLKSVVLFGGVDNRGEVWNETWSFEPTRRG